MGKSMYVNAKKRKLKTKIKRSEPMKSRQGKCRKDNVLVTVPVHTVGVSNEEIVEALCEYEEHVENVFPRIYHFDIAPLVCKTVNST